MLGHTPARSKAIRRWIAVGLLGGVAPFSAEGAEPPRPGGMLDLTKAVVVVPKGLSAACHHGGSPRERDPVERGIAAREAERQAFEDFEKVGMVGRSRQTTC